MNLSLPASLPDAMAPFLPGFRAIQQRIERIPGFFLLPVEIPGPDVARALGDFLTASGHPAIAIEPRDDEAAWKGLAAELLGAKPAPRGVVILIGSADPPASVHAALRLLNQRRDTLSKRLDAPLLWCGPQSFLDLSWEEAPDLWSTRATDVRLTEDTSSLLGLFEAAQAQGDRAAVRRFANRLAEVHREEGAPREAARILAEAESEGSQSSTAEDLLVRARVESANDQDVAAAGTLVELLALPDLRPIWRVRAQLEMARLLEDEDALERAADIYRDALVTAQTIADLETEARARIGLHGLEARTGHAAEAEEPLAGAQRIAARLGDRRLEAMAVAALALAAIGGHDTKTGKQRIVKAEELRARAEDEGRSPAALKEVDACIDRAEKSLNRPERSTSYASAWVVPGLVTLFALVLIVSTKNWEFARICTDGTQFVVVLIVVFRLFFVDQPSRTLRLQGAESKRCIDEFTENWKTLWVGWLLFYGVYVATYFLGVNNYKTWGEAGFAFITIVQSVSLYRLFDAMIRPADAEKNAPRRGFMLGVMICVGFFGFLPFLLDRSLRPDEAPGLGVALASGLLSATCLGLFVGRLESRYLDVHPYELLGLYLYVGTQPLFRISDWMYGLSNFRELHRDELGYANTTLKMLALVLKLGLYLVVARQFKKGRLVYYMWKVRVQSQVTKKEWASLWKPDDLEHK